MPVLGLILVILFTWTLMLGGILVIFTVIVPLPFLIPAFRGTIAIPVLQSVAAALVVLAWLYSILKIRDIYAKRKLWK
ncbi:MAG: hypothetical protein CMO12_01625 [Thaumarchaeota archaeon]|nr:hypothetical protein [Nitrososphaerota archaeon]|tara:strand:- start:712 stop:945 length:234 start_codon:yes stop_codon:yes gene_type:complete